MFGADLGWFWAQWLVRVPTVNYRLETVRVTPGAGGGSHVTLDVRRAGETIREPVEVKVTDRDGGERTLLWDDAQPAHQFDVDLPAGLSRVEVDPRHRLVETAVGLADRSPTTAHGQPHAAALAAAVRRARARCSTSRRRR